MGVIHFKVVVEPGVLVFREYRPKSFIKKKKKSVELWLIRRN